MKVLLINPPYPFEESPTPPFGLMSLAAFLLAKGVETIIEDYIITPYSPARREKILREFRPDVVGATGVTMNIKKSLSILEDFKKNEPRLITVMGGPHVTFDAQNILSDNPFVDYIVRGEGEITLTEMLSCLEAGGDMTSIEGISYRAGDRIVHNGDRPLIEDINILPYPARHLVQTSKYKALGFPINMVTSRGCPHKCIFCVGSRMVGRKVRYFSIERVVDEFEMLSKMGHKQINVVDDLFTSHKTRCIAICDEIMRRGITHPWTAFARVDTVSPELLASLKRAGCTTLCFGVESGNQEILDLVKKKITLEKCRAAVDMCVEAGIEPMASYILGLPGETPETVRKTLEFAKGLCSSYGYHILAPFPGTEVREKKEEYGIRILTDDWDLYDANRSVAESVTMPHQEIDRMVDEFNAAIGDYVREVLETRKQGKTLNEKDETTFRNVRTFFINQDIILKETFESYPGLNGTSTEEDLIRDLVRVIREGSTFAEDDIREELQRLLAVGSVRISKNNNIMNIIWN